MPDPGLQSISSQMEMMQQMQTVQTGMLTGAITALQQTIKELADAGRIGLATARQSGSTALASIQYGASTAIGDLRAVGQAIQAITPGPGPAPPVGGAIIAAGGGRTVAGPGIVHGTSVAALTGTGLLGEFAAFEAVAVGGGGLATLGAVARAGFAAGRGLMGGGAILGTAGGLAGGAIGAAGALAVPLAAGYAVGKVFETGVEHLQAAGSINALIRQNMWRNVPFAPGMDPSGMNFRPLAQEITGDITGIRGAFFGATEATQIVGMGMELGLFQGAGNAGDIRTRARELAQAVRDMTRDLGTSLQESMMMMAEVKQAGFDPTAAGGVLIQARGMGRAGGFTGAEMHMAGMRGAQAFRGLGVSPAFGYNAAQANLATASQLTLTGAVPPWLVASMGGRQAMAQQMTQGMANFISSPMGNVFTAALNAQGGQGNLMGGFEEIGAAAIQGAGQTAGQYVEFLANRRRLLEQAGPAGAQAFRAGIISQAFEREVIQQDPSFREMWENMTRAQRGERIGEYAAARFVGRMGIGTPDEARILGQLTQNPQTYDSQAQALRSEMHRTAMDRYMEEHGLPGLARKYVAQPIWTSMQWTGAQIARPFVGLAGAVEEAARDINDLIAGVERVTVTPGDVRAFTRENVRRARTEQVDPRLEREREIGREARAGFRLQRAALRERLAGPRETTGSESEALEAAYTRLTGMMGERGANLWGRLADAGTEPERKRAFKTLMAEMVPRPEVAGTSREQEELIQEWRDNYAAVAVDVARRTGTTDTLKVISNEEPAGSGFAPEGVVDPWQTTAVEQLGANIEYLGAVFQGAETGVKFEQVGWGVKRRKFLSEKERKALRTNISELYQAFREEDVTEVERFNIAEKIAPGGGPMLIQRLRRGMEESPEFRRRFREAAVGREAEMRPAIAERLARGDRAEDAGVEGTELQPKDPVARAAVARFEQVNAMFRDQHRTIRTLLDASQMMYANMKERSVRPKASSPSTRGATPVATSGG